MDPIPFLKSLHVIGWVSWFAGLFFLGRLLVNHAETDTRPAAERDVLAREYAGMEDRVSRIILRPAIVITWSAGLAMVGFNPGYFVAGTTGWLWTKLAFIVGLTLYHGYTERRIVPAMATGDRPLSSWQLRLWNEVPTFFLVAIVFTAVYGKIGQLNYWYLAAGVLLFSLMVYRGARAYAARRGVSQRGAEGQRDTEG